MIHEIENKKLYIKWRHNSMMKKKIVTIFLDFEAQGEEREREGRGDKWHSLSFSLGVLNRNNKVQILCKDFTRTLLLGFSAQKDVGPCLLHTLMYTYTSVCVWIMGVPILFYKKIYEILYFKNWYLWISFFFFF